MSTHTTPTRLGPKSRKIWHSVVDDYDLSAAEARVLEDACREVDLIERMELEQRDAPLTARGSMGQPVPAPLIGELRQHRATLARLLAQLGLDSGGASAQDSASQSARDLARKRWGSGAG